jgi:hypothetical protein
MRLISLVTMVLAALMVLGVVPAPSLAKAEAPPGKTKKKAKKKKAKKKNPYENSKADVEETIPSGEIAEDPWGEDEDSGKKDDKAEPEGEPSDDPAADSPAPASASSSMGSMRRSSRMEFDERLVKGQTAKSGAVYLFKRVPRKLPGLVPMRRSYRQRIVSPVLGERQLKPVVYSKRKDRLEKHKDGEAPEQDAKGEVEKKKVDEPETSVVEKKEDEKAIGESK